LFVYLFTLREKHRLRVLENRVLRKLLGLKWDEVTADRRRLQNEKLYDMNSSPNIIRVIKSRRMRGAEQVVLWGERRGVNRILLGRPEGKGPLGRPRRRWEDHIKMELQEVGLAGNAWVNLVQDRYRRWALVYAVMKLRVP
jgi:hypothetical protein